MENADARVCFRVWHFLGKPISLRYSLLIGVKRSSVLRFGNSRT